MGHVGRQIALLLRRLGHEVSVITQSPREDWLRGAREAGITVLLGDARDSKLLGEAGIERARALLATTSQDAVNIEIALDARRLRPELPVVVRLFDQTLARSIEGGAFIGVRRALGVSSLAAPTLAAALWGSDVQASFELGSEAGPGGAADSFVVGRTRGVLDSHASAGIGVVLGQDESGASLFLTTRAMWQELVGASRTPAEKRSGAGRLRLLQRLLRLRVVIDIWRNSPLALRSVLLLLWLLIAASVLIFRVGMHLSLVDAFYFIVTTVTTTGYGDITPKDSGAALKLYSCLMMLFGSAATALLYSLVTDFVINERFRRTFGQQRIPDSGHVIVVGLGNVGFRVRQELCRQGLLVVAINRTDQGEFFDAVRAEGPTIVGDGRLPETLLRAGLKGARGLVAATDDDATNLAIALAAQKLRGDLPTVVRLLDAEFANKVRRGLSLPAAFSSAAVAAPAFVAAALYEGVRAALVVENTLWTLCERRADPAWAGKTATEIATRFGVRPVLRLPPSAGTAPDFLAADSRIISDDRLLMLTELPLGAAA